MRLIDADSLKKWVEEYHTSNWGIPQDELIYAIGSAQTIDPVKHGKWEVKPTLKENVWLCRCSACRHKFSLNGSNRTIELAYCPWCGAKMDLEEGEKDGRQRKED